MIEPMRREDLDDVAALEAMVSNPAWSRAMFESELTTNQFAVFLVARVLDAAGAPALCGYIGFWIVFDELHLLNVAVHPAWQRQGIAGRLVQAAFDRANAGGALRALLEVRASNEAAQRLYARFGFQLIARRAGYYTNPTEDALIMGCEMRAD
ncbi:MAG: ribosomal protein S18-alanine N-acetyltransferase [Nitrospirota bacterium]